MNPGKTKTESPSVAIEIVTPKMAAAWLKNNHATQRNVTRSHAMHLTQQMRAGQWKMNGESIIIDWNGNIADGQHRLLSVSESGVACPFVVVRGIDPDCFPTIDRGKPRSNSNVFAIHGVANFHIVAAATAAVLNYRRALAVSVKKDGKIGTGGSLNSYVRASSSDLICEYEKHPDQYEFAVKIGTACRDKIAPSCSSTVAALSLIDGKMGRDWISEFWESFKTGANLAEKSPILKLRERLEKNKSSDAKLSQNQIIMLTVKAWNLYATEKDCGVLRVDSDGVVPVV